MAAIRPVGSGSPGGGISVTLSAAELQIRHTQDIAVHLANQGVLVRQERDHVIRLLSALDQLEATIHDWESIISRMMQAGLVSIPVAPDRLTIEQSGVDCGSRLDARRASPGHCF